MKNLAENLIELYGKGYVKNVNQDPNEGSFARYSIVQTKEKFNWHPETSHIDSFKLTVKFTQRIFMLNIKKDTLVLDELPVLYWCSIYSK